MSKVSKKTQRLKKRSNNKKINKQCISKEDSEIKLKNFLNNHSVSNSEFTHTSMCRGNYMKLGSFYIPKDDAYKFYKLYSDVVEKSDVEMYLTEKHIPNVGPICIDFDFSFKKKCNPRLITKQVAKNIVKRLVEILTEMFGNKLNYNCFVLQRPDQYIKKLKWTDGLHFQFPDIVCDYTYQFALREEFMKTYKFDFECEDSMDKIYDKSVIQTNNWCMYGSTKLDTKPYELKWIFNSTDTPNDFTTYQLVKILSIRNKTTESIELKNREIVDKYMEDSMKKKNKKIIKSITGNPEMLEIVKNQEYDEKVIKMLLNMLNIERVKCYGEWFQIITTLSHCSQSDKNDKINYKKIAHEWSKKSPNNYDKETLDNIWDYLIKNNKKYYTIGTLYHYAKLDNPKEYYKLGIFKYLQKIKNFFPDVDLTISKIINEKNTCYVELKETYCPFIKCHHEEQSIYLEVSVSGLIMKCRNKECYHKKIETGIKEDILKRLFGIDPMRDEEGELNSEILLKYEPKNFPNKIEVDEKYISKENIREMDKYNINILLSPTGSGKTTAINEFINNYKKNINKDPTILSIISRQSMSATHISAFKEHNMTSYLGDFKKINKNRYIISLEQLSNANTNYDILILDEITSLILHFYSPTMIKSRLRSFFILNKLIQNCKKIIACDAIITDMVLQYIGLLRSPVDIVFYKNIYKNKEGVHMKVYIRKNNSISKELELFCEPIIQLVRQKESILIVSDSKTIIDNIYYHLSVYNEDEDYFRIYTKTTGSFDELEKCNKIWKIKCVLFSPKIVYGLDVTIKYRCIFAIYQGNSIDSFSMLQQISRARNTKKVNVLFLLEHYAKNNNNYISYEKNKKEEEKELQAFITTTNSQYYDINIEKIKENMLHESASLTMTGQNNNIYEINKDGIFGKIHLYASWYKRLFDYNKSELFLQLCEKQGYIITKTHFPKNEKPSLFENVKKDMAVEETNQMIKLIKGDNTISINDMIDIKHRNKNLLKHFESRMKLLNIRYIDLKKDKHVRKLLEDETKFNKCIKSIILYYIEGYANEKFIKDYIKNFSFIEKSKRLHKIIKIIEWLEQEIEVDRFHLHEMQIDKNEIEELKEKMIIEIELFQWLSNSDGSKKRIDEITSRINNLTSEDKFQKFVIDIINNFDDFYTYNRKMKTKKRIMVYSDFSINNKTVEDHIKIINCLNMDAKKFDPFINKKINRKNNFLGEFNIHK